MGLFRRSLVIVIERIEHDAVPIKEMVRCGCFVRRHVIAPILNGGVAAVGQVVQNRLDKLFDIRFSQRMLRCHESYLRFYPDWGPEKNAPTRKVGGSFLRDGL